MRALSAPDDKVPAKFAAEPLVVVSNDERYVFAADGTGVYRHTVVARVQTESALKGLSVLSMPFASKSERVEWVYARVRHADGAMVETPVSEAIEVAEPVTREAPFYSDLKESHLPLRDLRVGDMVEWQVRDVRFKPEAAGEIWGASNFQHDGVVLEERLELRVAKEKKLTVWSPGQKAMETEENGENVWRWHSEQLKPTVGAAADAEREAEKKRVRTAAEEVDEREGKLADVAWTTFPSWAAVGAWYRGLEGDRMQPSAAVKAKVAQLTAGKTTEQEKVQAVYGYVGTQIHYIGVAFGVGRYQPHTADEVLENQYGDCKDKHTLLAAMLTALGLKPDAVLIGAGIRFNEAVPSPGSFNHLITRVSVDGKPVWLDTTAEVAPYGMLLYVTRDKNALVVPEQGEAAVVRTPKMPPFPESQTMTAEGSLDANGVSVSKITLTFRGDDEVTMRSVLRQLSPAQYDTFVQQLCANIGYVGTANHLEMSAVEDTKQPLRITFDYKREKAGDWANYRTIPQLAPLSLVRLDAKNPPVESVALGVPRIEESTAEMKIPEGWGVEFPEAVHEHTAYVNYDMTYRLEKGTMHSERRVEVLQERVPVSDWKTYNRFAEKVELGNEFYIQLTRPTGGTKGAAAKVEAVEPLSAEDQKDAAKLVAQAVELMQKDDLSGAAPLLDRAKLLNEKQLGLWHGYGWISFKHGELTEAIGDYRKELSYHPGQLGEYEPMAQLEVQLGHQDEAKKDWKAWAEGAPENPRPAWLLASELMEEGEAAEAVTTAKTALAATPADGKPDASLRLLLGRAQIRAGMKEQGHATLLALVKDADDPGMMNDAAYELADAGLELKLDEETVKTALDRMEAETRTWTLDENPQVLRQRTHLLQATWDTMGWVYFREGRLQEAEQYVQASWKGRQDAEVGKHLGEIAEARGDRTAALQDYDLAIETIPKTDDMGVRRAPRPADQDLRERAEGLRSKGVKAPAQSFVALEAVRKHPLGRGEDGVAFYRVLLSSEGVERLSASGAQSLPQDEPLLKKASLPGLLPSGSKAKLALFGTLNCHSGACEFWLEP